MTDQTAANSSETNRSPRQRAAEAYGNAREGMVDTLSEAPLIALAGGLAAGALIAALLPRTQAEERAVGPTARRVKDSARAAYQAARETGTRELDGMGLNREKGEETVRSLLEGIGQAARASADAALGAVRNKG